MTETPAGARGKSGQERRERDGAPGR